MKILRISNNIIEPAIATCERNRNNKSKDENTIKKSYSISHGTYGPGLWAIKVYLNVNHFTPTEIGDTIELTGDKYTISAIRKNKEIVKDKKNNNLYIISKDDVPDITNTSIVFWNIPLTSCASVNYIIDGRVREISLGHFGKFHIDTLKKVPAPLLEVYGDCVLRWYGYDPIEDITLHQTIRYDSKTDKWSSDIVKKEKGEKEYV